MAALQSLGTYVPSILLTPSLVANSWSKMLLAFQANIISTFLSTEKRKGRKKGMFSPATWPHLVTSCGKCATTHCQWSCILIKIRHSLIKDTKRYWGRQLVMSNCHSRLYCYYFCPPHMLLSLAEH